MSGGGEGVKKNCTGRGRRSGKGGKEGCRSVCLSGCRRRGTGCRQDGLKKGKVVQEYVWSGVASAWGLCGWKVVAC